jgi:hypothetical protein
MHKFKNSPVFLPISHEERVKEVFFESGGRINIHCETIEIELILFTICVKYAKAPFHLSHFVKSLGNSKYETPMKDIEEQVDRKMWVNKKGHLISAKPMAFKIHRPRLKSREKLGVSSSWPARNCLNSSRAPFR